MKNEEALKITLPKRDTDGMINRITKSNDTIATALGILAQTNQTLAENLKATNYSISISDCTVTTDGGVGISIGESEEDTEVMDYGYLSEGMGESLYDSILNNYIDEQEELEKNNSIERNKPKAPRRRKARPSLRRRTV